MAISRKLLEQGHELYLINRGNRNAGLAVQLPGTGEWNRPKEILVDINKEEEAAKLLEGMQFDSVADFIAFRKEQLERDYRLFGGRTRQFIYISSASAYQKPATDYLITESTPLCNPYWQYSRDKTEGEDYLMKLYREEGFPITIVRPSHTFDERSVPLGVHGANGSWQVLKRMLEGKPVIIHGDGTSLWTWNQIYEVAANALGVKLNAVHISTDFLAAAGGGKYDFTGSLTGDKSNSVVFDISKLKRLVPGFAPVKSMEQGLRETVQNVLAHPEFQREDPEFDSWCDRVIEARQKALDSLQQG